MATPLLIPKVVFFLQCGRAHVDSILTRPCAECLSHPENNFEVGVWVPCSCPVRIFLQESSSFHIGWCRCMVVLWWFAPGPQHKRKPQTFLCVQHFLYSCLARKNFCPNAATKIGTVPSALVQTNHHCKSHEASQPIFVNISHWTRLWHFLTSAQKMTARHPLWKPLRGLEEEDQYPIQDELCSVDLHHKPVLECRHPQEFCRQNGPFDMQLNMHSTKSQGHMAHCPDGTCVISWTRTKDLRTSTLVRACKTKQKEWKITSTQFCCCVMSL